MIMGGQGIVDPVLAMISALTRSFGLEGEIRIYGERMVKTPNASLPIMSMGRFVSMASIWQSRRSQSQLMTPFRDETRNDGILGTNVESKGIFGATQRVAVYSYGLHHLSQGL